MKTRKIGRLDVSPVGMGCMGFSHGYGQVPSEEYSIDAIRKAYDFGCNFFDTAESYGKEMFYPGHNEQLVGKAVEPFREKIVLATKFHLDENEITDEVDLYAAIRKHLEASLQNLRTDYGDLYYLHRVNELIPLEDIAEVMGQLINEGLIKEWGLSQVSVEQLANAHEETPVAAVQNLYSMVERDAEKDIFPYCLANGITVVPFSPIASGLLSGKVTTETKFEGDDVRKFVPQLSKENLTANQPIIDLITQFASAKGATNAQISLAWMLHKYPNVVPIPGSKNQERIIENLSAWNVELTDEEFNALETALDKLPVHGHRGHVESQQKSFGSQWRKK
ncbi:aldo/keto reductase [Fundicoccus culcitae]|uniref:Aldo/keto reductase n=1 Tax=Fundicoccus culcitae TaxID=2969821 RepID=A0ABY5P8S3_9LACT|nr:aldo/keto reductase [Fundicoccus culcitae]UUX35152.1 aldo/keto reductase [Fundicoccus culcitae]